MKNTDGAERNLAKIKDMLETVKTMTDADYRAWLDATSIFHHYSFSNRILIWLSGGTSVMGAKQWEKYERSVAPDQKYYPIWILAPTIIKKAIKVNRVNPVTNRMEEQDDETTILVGFKCVKVYDIKQTTGKPLPEIMTKRSNVDMPTLIKVATELGFKVNSRPMEFSVGGCLYHNDDGHNNDICLNSNRAALDNIGTLIHELSHGLLKHHTDDRKDIPRDQKECEAETLTYLLCHEYGIERQSQFYLKSWGMKDEIFNSFIFIDKGMNAFKKAFAGQEKAKEEKVA
jgi:hypothetical protein